MTDALKARIPNPPHEARPWGFKDAHKLPRDYQTKLPRPVLTPQKWKRLSLLEDASGFSIVSFATQQPIIAADLKLLSLSLSLKMSALSREKALALGEEIEKAFRRLLFPLDRAKRGKHKRTQLTKGK